MKKSQQIINTALFSQIFNENREWITLCQIMEEEMAMDGSAYQVRVETIPLNREALVHVARDPAISSPAREGDLWICCFLKGDHNNGFLLQKVTNMNEKIHPKSVEGETVVSSRKEKNINLSNNPLADLDNPVLLGKVTSEWLVKLTKKIEDLTDDLNALVAKYNAHLLLPQTTSTLPAQIPNQGTASTVKVELGTLKSDAEQTKLKSDLVFVQERGLKG